MPLDGIVLEVLTGSSYSGPYGSWSMDIPLVPPPGLTPVPFVTADAGVTRTSESGH